MQHCTKYFRIRKIQNEISKRGMIWWSPSQHLRLTWDMPHKSFDGLGLTKWWLVDTSAEPSCFQLCRGETMSTTSDSSGVHFSRTEHLIHQAPPSKATNKVHLCSNSWELIHLCGPWIFWQSKPVYLHDAIREHKWLSPKITMIVSAKG